MDDQVKVNGRASVLQIITVVAQFLLLPLLWLIYQMYLDVGVMKVQLAKLEGKLESHQEYTQLESQNRSLRNELDHVKTMVSEHRRKSTYDKQ